MRSSTDPNRGFAAHFAKVLARKLHPHTEIRPKQLTVIGWSYDRITAWLRGESAPPGEAIHELNQLFRSALGDRSFIVEVFGEQSEAEAARMSAEIEAMQQRLAEMQAGLRDQAHVAPVQARGGMGHVEAKAPAGQVVGTPLAQADGATRELTAAGRANG